MMSSHPVRVVAVLTCVAGLAACGGMFEGKKIDYKSAESRPLPKLEVPPDLATPGKGSRYALPDRPDSRAAATYSEYESNRAARPAGTATPAGTTVLPSIDKVTLERAGGQRWLKVALPPEQIWPVLREFWQENGFLVARDEPAIGLMETDWAENRAKIPREGLTGMINRALDRVTSFPERDRFRVRLERAADGKSTEVYLSHRGMAEVFKSNDPQERATVWQVRPVDPELEAEFLQRFAVRLGVNESQAVALVKDTPAGTAPATGATPAAPKRAVTTADGTVVKLDESFDRAWRRVGLALDRVGFMVEDRDRAGGLYYVRYQDPDAPRAKPSALSKLAFWRTDEGPKGAEQFRVLVAAPAGASGVTEVRVVDDKGGTRDNATAKRIIGLLAEQLR
ncbi:MAG: outer membrane protein assembly factor BamC [Burkholderiales bacterium]|nr:outer membrane protein assembly factor BamC [Burkholderiales bacterium]